MKRTSQSVFLDAGQLLVCILLIVLANLRQVERQQFVALSAASVYKTKSRKVKMLISKMSMSHKVCFLIYDGVSKSFRTES